jgi:mannose-6-phosphate isomerase-like protein (cupin superfamily)
MPAVTTQRRWQIVDFGDLAAVPCPCGTARRAFADVADFPATVHQTEISADALAHYHRRLTEVYYILECGPDAQMQLDDQLVPLAAGRAILIPPGVRHRAIGTMKVLVIVFPKFDPSDEWFD